MFNVRARKWKEKIKKVVHVLNLLFLYINVTFCISQLVITLHRARLARYSMDGIVGQFRCKYFKYVNYSVVLEVPCKFTCKLVSGT